MLSCGAEVALKREAAHVAPGFAPAYQRPGLVTFRAPFSVTPEFELSLVQLDLPMVPATRGVSRRHRSATFDRRGYPVARCSVRTPPTVISLVVAFGLAACDDGAITASLRDVEASEEPDATVDEVDPDADDDADGEAVDDVAHDQDATVDDASDGGVESGAPAVVACGSLEPSGEVLLRTYPASDVVLRDDRVLGYTGMQWHLRDRATLEVLAHGEHNPESMVVAVDDFFVVERAGGTLEVRDFATANILSELPARRTFGAAVDGSYLWTADATGLYLWTVAGAPLAAVQGDYSAAGVDFDYPQYRARMFFADADGVRFARLSGDMERVTLDGKHSSGAHFAGKFRRWFADGSRFLTDDYREAYVYTADGDLLEQALLPAFAAEVGEGYGDYYWVLSAGVAHLFRISEADTPILSIPTGVVPRSVGLGLYVVPWLEQVTLVDLRGSSPIQTDLELLDHTVVVAMDGRSGELWTARQNGLARRARGDSVFQVVSCGDTTIRASKSGTWFLIAGVGQTLVVDVETRQLERTLPLPFWRAEVSDDGTLIGGSMGPSGRGSLVRSYATDTGELLGELAGPFSDLSDDGTVLASAYCEVGCTYSTVQTVSGERTSVTHYLSVRREDRVEALRPYAIYLSPRGHRAAVSTLSGEFFVLEGGEALTGPYGRGVELDGGVGPLLNVLDWLDEERILGISIAPANEFVVVTRQGEELSSSPVAANFPYGRWIGGTEVNETDTPRVYDFETGELLSGERETRYFAGAADAKFIMWLTAFDSDIRLRARYKRAALTRRPPHDAVVQR